MFLSESTVSHLETIKKRSRERMAGIFAVFQLLLLSLNTFSEVNANMFFVYGWFVSFMHGFLHCSHLANGNDYFLTLSFSFWLHLACAIL